MSSPRKDTRLLSLVLVLALSGCAGGSATIKTVNDPFKGPIRSFMQYLDPGGYTAVGMSEFQGKHFVVVLAVQSGVSDAKGAVGEEGQFKLGQKTLTLQAVSAAQPTANAIGREVFTQWLLEYSLTPEQVAAFAADSLSAVKVAVSERAFQFELTPGQSRTVQSNARILASPSDTRSP